MEGHGVAFTLGWLRITSTVVTTWGLMLLFWVLCALATRRLSVERPGLLQTALEGVVQSIESAIERVLPGRSQLLLPFVGTLWLFVTVGTRNLAMRWPGAEGTISSGTIMRMRS